MRRTLIAMSVLVTLIVAAHVALWLSDAPHEAKLRLTLLNAAVWAVILLPALGVGLWLRAHKAQGLRGSAQK